MSIGIELRIDEPIAISARFTVAGFTCLLGASGAGKTTVLRALAGLVPAAGALPRRVGYLPQNSALFPHLTSLQNAAYALRGAGRHARARALLDELGVGHLAARRAEGLSGGEAQRVGLARALAHAPEMLLLDEPSAALDPATKEAVFSALIETINARALPALAATHDPALALLADRLVLLDAGRILQEGTPRALARAPAGEAAARLLGFQNIWRDADGRARAIRAEDVLLDDGPGSFEARLHSVHDSGHMVRLAVSAPFPLIAILRDPPGLAPGDTIRLRLPENRVVALP